MYRKTDILMLPSPFFKMTSLKTDLLVLTDILRRLILRYLQNQKLHWSADVFRHIRSCEISGYIVLD